MKMPKFFRSKKSKSQESASENFGSRSVSSASSEESAESPESQNYSNHSSAREIEEAPKQVGSNVASSSKLEQREQWAANSGTVVDSADQELRAAFSILDRNKDGKISADELGAVLKLLGDDMSNEYLQGMVAAVDANQDGEVDFQEFLELNKRACEDVARSGELRAAFSIFDINKDEYISADELHQVLNNLGQQPLSREDCSRMIKAVDKNDDGMVDFGEFEMMMTGTRLF